MAEAASQEKPAPKKGAWRWLRTAKDWIAASLKRELWNVPLWLWAVGLLPWAAFTFWLLWSHLLPVWPYLLPTGQEAFPVGEDTAYHYLLSALSQGMAAVLALTFTISLVAAQLTTRYSYGLLQRLLPLPTILYILLFALAVVLPLALLPSPTPFQVKLSLSLSALTLTLLVPYLRYFLYRITPRSLLADLAQEVERNLLARQPAPEVETIDNIAMSAFGFKDYDTFSLALRKLGDLALAGEALKGQGKAGRPTEELTEDMWRRCREVALVTLEDPRAARLSIAALRDVGRAAAQKGLEVAAWQAASALGEVGRAARRKGAGRCRLASRRCPGFCCF